ncbi:MAG TPA: hypothetical protein VJH65_03340 [Candidatus Nanoarchaeia archaeon]|nr:hypothetical protein [Candidatus Nanoarchaeia archaeon]
METKNVLVVLAGALVLSLIVSLAVVGGFKGTGYTVGDTVKVRVAEGKSGTFSLGGVKRIINVVSANSQTVNFNIDNTPLDNILVDSTKNVIVGNLQISIDKVTSFFGRDYVYFTVTEVAIERVTGCAKTSGNNFECVLIEGVILVYEDYNILMDIDPNGNGAAFDVNGQEIHLNYLESKTLSDGTIIGLEQIDIAKELGEIEVNPPGDVSIQFVTYQDVLGMMNKCGTRGISTLADEKRYGNGDGKITGNEICNMAQNEICILASFVENNNVYGVNSCEVTTSLYEGTTQGNAICCGLN